MAFMQLLRRLGPLGPLAFLSVVVPPVSGILLLGTMHRVGPWLREHDTAGVLVYLAAFTVLGGLALLPTYAQSLLGGWAFGFAVGLPTVLAGFAGAALVNYAIASRVSGDRLERLLAENPRWDGVYRILLRSHFRQALVVLTLVRLPPNAPFAATNVALSAMRAPLVPFTLGTIAGIAPRAAAVVYAGAGLAVLDLHNRVKTGWFAAGVFITLAVVATLGWLANRALKRVDATLAAARLADGAAAGEIRSS